MDWDGRIGGRRGPQTKLSFSWKRVSPPKRGVGA